MKRFVITLIIIFGLSTASSARVYLDITSPGFRAIPIAVYDLLGSSTGKEIRNIIAKDLEFSGVFLPVDKEAYIETPLPVFDPSNWTALGVELVVKGSVIKEGDEIVVVVYLFDVIEARKILQKKYRAKERFLIPLSHTISNDIYRKITGKESMFKTKIAFIGEEKSKRTIYIMDWDGKRLTSTGIKAPLIMSLHWSKDANRLLYSSVRGLQWGIYLADFKKKKETIVYRSTATNIAGDFLPEGNSFLFSSSRKGSPDLYIYHLNSKRIERITWKRGIEVSPAISPDGKKIAFVSDHSGTPQIYIMGLDGRGLRRISFSSGYCTSPSWSPAGDSIAYSGMIGGKHQIFVVDLESGDYIQLTEQGNNEEPSFSPDGRFITFTSDREGYKRVYIMRANGEAQQPVSPKKMRAFGPKWSPK
jgi:TolB protein